MKAVSSVFSCRDISNNGLAELDPRLFHGLTMLGFLYGKMMRISLSYMLLLTDTATATRLIATAPKPGRTTLTGLSIKFL